MAKSTVRYWSTLGPEAGCVVLEVSFPNRTESRA